jgi:hypothetical protein
MPSKPLGSGVKKRVYQFIQPVTLRCCKKSQNDHFCSRASFPVNYFSLLERKTAGLPDGIFAKNHNLDGK